MKHKFSVRLGAAVAGVTLLAVACSSGGDDEASTDTSESTAAAEADVIFPGEEWATEDAEELGFDPAILEELAAEAEANESNCVIVTRHGKIAGEWYFGDANEDSVQEIFSATKSFTSTLVGIAQDDGDLAIDDPAADYIPEWEGTDSEDVTIKNLISNDSGRHWVDVVQDISALTAAQDRTGYAIGLGQDVAPGTFWAYNNAAIQTLDQVISEATGEPTRDFAQSRIFEPIRMDDTEMTETGAGGTNTYFGMQSTCRDMARFGYLFLRGGEWDGEQIVSENFVEEATGAPSQDLNSAYGYLWWLNHRGPMPGLGDGTGAPTEEAEEGQLVPGAPEDMYWAQGLGGQIIQVDEASDTVVVRLGSGNVAATYGSPHTAKFVTEALVEP